MNAKSAYTALFIVGALVLFSIIGFMVAGTFYEKIETFIAGFTSSSDATASTFVGTIDDIEGDLPHEYAEFITPLVAVGEEQLYYGDLDFEISQYPVAPNEDVSDFLTQKIIRDSVILQAALEAGFIEELPENVFNDIEKNYIERFALIQEIEEEYNKQSGQFRGGVISIWFDTLPTNNTGTSLEDRKALALSKITEAHTAISSGSKSIEEVAEDMKVDAALEAVDSQYAINAYLPFDIYPFEQITFDLEFDALLKNTAVGGTTDVYTGQDRDYFAGDDSPKVDAVYLFGYVMDKSEKTVDLTFDEWVARQMSLYEITYD